MTNGPPEKPDANADRVPSPDDTPDDRIEPSQEKPFLTVEHYNNVYWGIQDLQEKVRTWADGQSDLYVLYSGSPELIELYNSRFGDSYLLDLIVELDLKIDRLEEELGMDYDPRIPHSDVTEKGPKRFKNAEYSRTRPLGEFYAPTQSRGDERMGDRTILLASVAERIELYNYLRREKRLREKSASDLQQAIDQGAAEQLLDDSREHDEP